MKHTEIFTFTALWPVISEVFVLISLQLLLTILNYNPIDMTGLFALKNGRVSEQGTFDALMAEKGYFDPLFTVFQR